MAKRSEGGRIEAVGERPGVGPGAGSGDAFAKLVTVIGAHDPYGSAAVQQAGLTLSVMGLALGQREWDG